MGKCNIIPLPLSHVLHYSKSFVKKKMEDVMISPEKIKLMRKLGGRATQDVVGAAIGLERSTYARREAAGDFSQAELEKMARLLKCKVEDFFDDGARAPTETHSDCRAATNDAMIHGMRETISILREQIETQREFIDMLKAQLSKKEREDEDPLPNRKAN